jgi:F0F1-type ATP synthase membrane subunit c/vacuolar-type H+-ATPase subunit K
MIDDYSRSSVISGRLRALQIIAAALIAGVVLFGLIVGMIILQQQPQPGGGAAPGAAPSSGSMNVRPPVDLLRYVAIGLLIMGTIGALSILRLAATQTAREFRGRQDLADETTQESLFSRFYIARLIGLALVESAALLAIVIAMVGGRLADLAIAGVAVAVMLLLLFPTGGRWNRFVHGVTADDTRLIGER